MLVGEWASAREFSEHSLATVSLDERVLFNRIMLEYQVGHFSNGAAHVDRLLELMYTTSPGPNLDTVLLAMAISLGSRITGTSERLEVAEMAAEAALSSHSKG